MSRRCYQHPGSWLELVRSPNISLYSNHIAPDTAPTADEMAAAFDEPNPTDEQLREMAAYYGQEQWRGDMADMHGFRLKPTPLDGLRPERLSEAEAA